MSFRFTHEHFISVSDHPTDKWFAEKIATLANRLLDEHVSKLQEVGGRIDLQFGVPTVWTPLGHDEGQVYRAKLWGAKKIKPTQCDHEVCVNENDVLRSGDLGSCFKCRKKLEATWTELEG